MQGSENRIQVSCCLWCSLKHLTGYCETQEAGADGRACLRVLFHELQKSIFLIVQIVANVMAQFSLFSPLLSYENCIQIASSVGHPWQGWWVSGQAATPPPKPTSLLQGSARTHCWSLMHLCKHACMQSIVSLFLMFLI